MRYVAHLEGQSKQTKMEIRAATINDVPQIVKLIGDIWAEYNCVLNTATEEKYLLAPDNYFHTRDGEFWVVVESGQIVATVAVMMNDPETAELKSLYVHKENRRRGLGERLTKMTLDFSREKGARRMLLWSDTRFIKAHRLYERIGFERFGQRELDDLNNSVEFGFQIRL